MDRIILKHVGQVVGGQEVVDANHLDARKVLGDSAEGHAADAAKTVDAHFDRHAFAPGLVLLKEVKGEAGPPIRPRGGS